MKVLVCGSRHFQDYALLEENLDRIHNTTPISEIIHGDARGADRLSESYAVKHGIPVRRFPALWDLHGKRAGPIRNHQMLREGNPDRVVAFLAVNSRGTKHMIEIAEKAGVPVQIVEFANE